MLKNISPLERMLLVSVSFTMLLLLTRVMYTKELVYGFYIWNTFLAILPLLFSRSLIRQNRFNLRAILLLTCWLAFFPNAAYIITDLFHYTEKPPVPKWFDLLLVTSAAWNGLLLGIVSLMQIEQFLSGHLRDGWVKISVIISFILCGYGVYIGRYLRFNSWDAVTEPQKLLYTFSVHIFRPQEHVMMWAFTFLFGTMFGIVYFTLKQFRLPAVVNRL
ncbi:DUF1361 domain-containing protein [Chitinophaga filiformis]|uniref:DUF1361 domain-containing protein n=1 Tax=Chitinophaga filiformis TaxID=104663 RepID=UPI001F3AD17C|nr:DUF1361 domain-containing protein [Chitinophaga filiformis]MCF6402551.1 DUF1361 domain-containing protein [Chitinophaga filiformis]MCF6403531.1 DUF1361 domain-containing protein [Chitinophaga filiformis]